MPKPTKPPEMIELKGSSLPGIPGARPISAPLSRRAIDISIWLRRKSGVPFALPKSRDDLVSRDDLAKTWGASPQDLKEVLKHLRKFDAKAEYIETPRFPALDRRIVTIRGAAAALACAFGIKLEEADLGGREPIRARSGPLMIPPHLEGIVLGVFGLDERPVGEPHNAVLDAASPATEPLVPTPKQVAELYNFKSVASCEGQVIALMQFGGGYREAVVRQYFQDNGFGQPQLKDVGIDGVTNAPPSSPPSPSDREVMLDIEVAGAVAERATLVSYFSRHTERGWIEAISSAVHDTVENPMIMSISWGGPEYKSAHTLTWSEAGMRAMHSQFQDACLIGMTVLASAGNHGSDCKVGDWAAHVNYPASDPLVLACGGTAIVDYAMAPHVEVAWKHGGGAGGGGVSEFFRVPGYQVSLTLPVHAGSLQPGRTVPDVAGYAWPGYDFDIGEGHPTRMPGTSLVAPLYAGAAARISASLHGPVGQLHLMAYGAPNTVRDISDRVSNNTSNRMNGAPGYFGGPGYDARTGLGVFQPGK